MSDASMAPPVCPRHPTTVSYVTCQRCGRPTCPACQRPAAVGIQCVDCVHQAAKAAPTQRTALGGRLRTAGMPVTLVIIGICVVSWLLQLVTGGAWTQALAFWPGIGLHEPWRFLTAAFLHSTMPMHIMFNMYALFITGQFLEPVLGRARYITLCLLAAIGGSVGVVLLTSPTASPQGFITWGPAVVGASGMVFGLFGAMIPVLRRLGNNAYQIIGVIAINAAIGFLVSGIAWQAHAGGLVVGLALGYGYAHAPRDKRQLVGWLLPTGIVAVLIAITLIRYTQTGWIHTL